jgi:hypothetical protein
MIEIYYLRGLLVPALLVQGWTGAGAKLKSAEELIADLRDNAPGVAETERPQQLNPGVGTVIPSHPQERSHGQFGLPENRYTDRLLMEQQIEGLYGRPYYPVRDPFGLYSEQLNNLIHGLPYPTEQGQNMKVPSYGHPLSEPYYENRPNQGKNYDPVGPSREQAGLLAERYGPIPGLQYQDGQMYNKFLQYASRPVKSQQIMPTADTVGSLEANIGTYDPDLPGFQRSPFIIEDDEHDDDDELDDDELFDEQEDVIEEADKASFISSRMKKRYGLDSLNSSRVSMPMAESLDDGLTSMKGSSQQYGYYKFPIYQEDKTPTPSTDNEASTGKITPPASVPVLGVPVPTPEKEKAMCIGIKLKCKQDGVRSIDGTCNNYLNPFWGASGAPFTRVLGPRYSSNPTADPPSNSDLLSSSLPNPSLLSRALFTTPPSAELKRDEKRTMMAVAMLHFVFNDISQAAVPADPDLDCCGKDAQNSKCFPIVDPGSVAEHTNICRVTGGEKREECCLGQPAWRNCGSCTPCTCSVDGDCLLREQCRDGECLDPCQGVTCDTGLFCQPIQHRLMCRDCSQLPPNADPEWRDLCTQII